MSQFKRVEDGIFIGPEPAEQDLQDAKQRGIRTVIYFRLPSETATSNEILTKTHGLTYVNIPVNKAALSASQFGELDAAMQGKDGRFASFRNGGTCCAATLIEQGKATPFDRRASIYRSKENGVRSDIIS